jgi:cyanophycin synthetase
LQLRALPTPAPFQPSFMQILETIVYRGPNRWSKKTTIELKLALAQQTARDVELLAATIHELQLISGVAVSWLDPNIGPSSACVAAEFEEEALTRECIKTAMRLLEESGWRKPELSTFEERRLVDLADDLRLGPSSRAILDAATARGIPYHRLNRGSLVQLGEGRHHRRIWTAETDATSAIAEAIASDKQLTRSILESIGVNVPLGSLVSSAEEAWQVAQQIGLPVAVKPCNANHARGVSLELSDRQSILDAYEWAKTDGQTDEIMVEQFIVGDHHRILVVGDQMVAAARGQREFVCGDGQHSIAELVAKLNSDPRRGENYTDPLGIVPLDDAARIVLSKQGLDFHSIPAAGTQVLVKHVGDLIEDCTDIVHPLTARTAVLAAQAIGLDIAGLDLVAVDIAKPLREQRGGIVEVNAGPSLTPHVKPLRGTARPVGEAVMKMLFPIDDEFQIPTLIVVSDKGESTKAKQILLQLTKQPMVCAFRSRVAMSIEGQALPPSSDPLRDIRGMLGHPNLEALIIDVSVESILRKGFPCRRADLILLDVATLDDSVQIRDETTAHWLSAVKNLASDETTIVALSSEENCYDPLKGSGLHIQFASNLDLIVSKLTSKARKV